MGNGPFQPANVPDKAACEALMAEMEMMAHIAAHCRQVCRVALWIADRLDGRGSPLDRRLIRAAALLHDITKTRSLRTGENHAATGRALLERRGYPEVGAVIAQHVRLKAYEDGGPVREEEIVNYADKRVLHDRIVSLAERMGYILERYGRDEQRRNYILAVWEQTRGLEAKLFRQIPFSPEDIPRRLDPAFRGHEAPPGAGKGSGHVSSPR